MGCSECESVKGIIRRYASMYCTVDRTDRTLAPNAKVDLLTLTAHSPIVRSDSVRICSALHWRSGATRNKFAHHGWTHVSWHILWQLILYSLFGTCQLSLKTIEFICAADGKGTS